MSETQIDFDASKPDDPPPTVVLYDPARARENVRGIIALSLIVLLGLIVLVSVVMLWIHPDRDASVQHWLEIVFGPVIALVGSATGFYFGAREAPPKS